MDLATFYATILLIELESEKKNERERETWSNEQD